MASWGTVVALGAGRLSETLLPDTTKGLFAISNVDGLSEHWNQTQLGHLMADPVMEPFTKDVRRQFEERWSSIHDRLGLTIEELKGVPGGDSAIALIAPAPGKAALAIVIDITGKGPQAAEMLKKVTARQLERGATRSEAKVKGCPDVVVQFDLPQPEDEKEATASTLRGSAKSEADEGEADKGAKDVPLRRAYYCLTGNLLAVTDDFDVMKGILGRAQGNQNGSLADHKPFQKVIGRCRSDYGKEMPQMRWFIHPLGYAEAARAATPANKLRKGKSILEIMRNQGVGAVLGVGGFVDFAAEGYELVHRTAIYAPKPYVKAMKMAVLPNEKIFEPQPWVPSDVATYATFYFDILNAFDNFGPLFEEMFQNEPGVWDDVLESLKAEDGPQIDLREEMIAKLGQRISVLTDYELPITTTSERLLFAIEAKDAKAVAAALEKLFRNDPTIQPCDEKGQTIEKFKADPTYKPHDVDGHVIWRVVEDETGIPEAPTISFGEDPAAAPVHPHKKRLRPKASDEEEEDDKEPRLLPHAAITVWQGNLIVASHLDFLVKVVAPKKEIERLRDDADYQFIADELNKLEPKKRCVRFFSRTDEEYRPTYELIRQNKMPESETMLARVLNGLFGEGKKGAPRTQKIDGSQLPEYKMVRRYLGPAGLQATSEDDGWYLKGFTLDKEAQEAPHD